MHQMRFHECSITLQEVPNEISLCFTITGCEIKCKGCHSEHLWDSKNGIELTEDFYIKKIKKYNDAISCILFMGGEWNELELLSKLKIAKELGKKTALYTGMNYTDFLKRKISLIPLLDFLKTGGWNPRKGGLDKEGTNQEFRNLQTNELINHLFKKKY